MSELENEENIKNTIQDTQMLIRNHMQQHKKISKQLHGQIKKDKKTIELFKEKIAKLILEKKKLEEKQHLKGDIDQSDTPQIQELKIAIKTELEEKKSFDDKIADIQNEFLVIKNEMGGLNATQALKERYEKHIRILENRLDKANQKFNDAIEYDKNLRNEIIKNDKKKKDLKKICVSNSIIIKKKAKKILQLKALIKQKLKEEKELDIQLKKQNLKSEKLKEILEISDKFEDITTYDNLNNNININPEYELKNEIEKEKEENNKDNKEEKDKVDEQNNQENKENKEMRRNIYNANGEAIRKQIKEKEEKRKMLERGVIEEGRQIKQELDGYKKTLERIKKEKLDEMERYHIDPKYRVDLQKYKIH